MSGKNNGEGCVGEGLGRVRGGVQRTYKEELTLGTQCHGY